MVRRDEQDGIPAGETMSNPLAEFSRATREALADRNLHGGWIEQARSRAEWLALCDAIDAMLIACSDWNETVSATRAAAFEECARICEHGIVAGDITITQEFINANLESCAAAIRAAKEGK